MHYNQLSTSEIAVTAPPGLWHRRRSCVTVPPSKLVDCRQTTTRASSFCSVCLICFASCPALSCLLVPVDARFVPSFSFLFPDSCFLLKRRNGDRRLHERKEGSAPAEGRCKVATHRRPTTFLIQNPPKGCTPSVPVRCAPVVRYLAGGSEWASALHQFVSWTVFQQLPLATRQRRVRSLLL